MEQISENDQLINQEIERLARNEWAKRSSWTEKKDGLFPLRKMIEITIYSIEMNEKMRDDFISFFSLALVWNRDRTSLIAAGEIESVVLSLYDSSFFRCPIEPREG